MGRGCGGGVNCAVGCRIGTGSDRSAGRASCGCGTGAGAGANCGGFGAGRAFIVVGGSGAGASSFAGSGTSSTVKTLSSGTCTRKAGRNSSASE